MKKFWFPALLALVLVGCGDDDSGSNKGCAKGKVECGGKCVDACADGSSLDSQCQCPKVTECKAANTVLCTSATAGDKKDTCVSNACGSEQEYDAAICGCKCTDANKDYCKGDAADSSLLTTCVSKICPSGATYDANACACACGAGTALCTGANADASLKNTCVNNSCGTDNKYDADSCTCVPDCKAADNKVLCTSASADASLKNTCVSNACGADKKYDADSCTCVPDCTTANTVLCTRASAAEA